MSKHLPPKLNFKLEMVGMDGNPITGRAFSTVRLKDVIDEYDRWWNAEIVPLFKNAMQVYSTKVLKDKPITTWFTEKQIDNIHGIDWSTHTALLINIKPKEQTAEDLLRELLSDYENGGRSFVDFEKAFRQMVECIEKNK